MLNYVTKDSSDPRGKRSIFFASLPENAKDRNHILSYFFDRYDCAVYYSDNAEWGDEELSELIDMDVIIIDVSVKVVYSVNDISGKVYRYAIDNSIPILLITFERPENDKIFISDLKIKDAQEFISEAGSVFDNRQLLAFFIKDNTQLSVYEKLDDRLLGIFKGYEYKEEIKSAFDVFVFLSYRKKDRAYAQKLMRLIHSEYNLRDIAIWYDEFIALGEPFDKDIQEQLVFCNLFMLTVTPNLLEKNNYISTKEYPDAVKLFGDKPDKDEKIIPVEVMPTDEQEIKKMYKGIPDFYSITNGKEQSFLSAFNQVVNRILRDKRDLSPRHLFFIGLAYLNGIYVERNQRYAESFFIEAAESGVEEASESLVNFYSVSSNHDFVSDQEKKDSCQEKNFWSYRENTEFWANRISKKYPLDMFNDDKKYIRKSAACYRRAVSLKLNLYDKLEACKHFLTRGVTGWWSYERAVIIFEYAEHFNDGYSETEYSYNRFKETVKETELTPEELAETENLLYKICKARINKLYEKLHPVLGSDSDEEKDYSEYINVLEKAIQAKKKVYEITKYGSDSDELYDLYYDMFIALFETKKFDDAKNYGYLCKEMIGANTQLAATRGRSLYHYLSDIEYRNDNIAVAKDLLQNCKECYEKLLTNHSEWMCEKYIKIMGDYFDVQMLNNEDPSKLVETIHTLLNFLEWYIENDIYYKTCGCEFWNNGYTHIKDIINYYGKYVDILYTMRRYDDIALVIAKINKFSHYLFKTFTNSSWVGVDFGSCLDIAYLDRAFSSKEYKKYKSAVKNIECDCMRAHVLSWREYRHIGLKIGAQTAIKSALSQAKHLPNDKEGMIKKATVYAYAAEVFSRSLLKRRLAKKHAKKCLNILDTFYMNDKEENCEFLINCYLFIRPIIEKLHINKKAFVLRILRLSKIIECKYDLNLEQKDYIPEALTDNIPEEDKNEIFNEKSTFIVPEGKTEYERLYQLNDYENVTKVILPSTLVEIKNLAFSAWKNLAEIDFPEGLKKIGAYAFDNCEKLNFDKLPDSVETIQASAFSNCKSLTLECLPEGITYIGRETFYGCSSLQLKELPQSVTIIHDFAFQNCSALKLGKLPKNLSKIGIAAFSDCASLELSELPELISNIAERTFYNCVSLNLKKLPSGLHFIGTAAFSGCIGLALSKLSDNLRYIMPESFLGCISLAITRLPEKLSALGAKSFKNCKKITLTNLPSFITSVEEETFYGCESIVEMSFDGITEIGKSAFSCTGLIEVSIPYCVEKIGDNAFAGCPLKKVALPKNFEADISRIFGDVDKNIITLI